MSESELQTEEIEALESIYEGDLNFKQLNSTTFQYKYGEEGTDKTFMLELTWGQKYPNELPTISMDTYYNRIISQPFKSKIIDLATKEGENWIGCGMTYTLFECLKEQITELLDELEEEVKNAAVLKVSEDIRKVQLAPVISTGDTQAPVKKEQMTKNQKRRLWDRSDNKGNKQRGWDWVCLIRHLSQGGQREDVVPTPQQSTQSSSQLAPPPNNY